MGLNDEYQLGVYIGMLMKSESIISMVMKKRTDCSKYISSTDLTCFIPMIRMTLLLQFHNHIRFPRFQFSILGQVHRNYCIDHAARIYPEVSETFLSEGG